jgi:hypothetical protein
MKKTRGVLIRSRPPTCQGRPVRLPSITVAPFTVRSRTIYSSADAFTYTANPLPSKYEGAIVRGKPAMWAHHDERPCLVPPDWSGGYTSLYAMQQGEQWDEEQLETVAKQTAQIRRED